MNEYYSNDPRDIEANYGCWPNKRDLDENKMVFHLSIEEDENGDSYEVDVPAKYEVCGLCDGHGSHVNPSIDYNGISGADLYDDPEFASDYCSGMYDVSCYRCEGKRVEPVIDRDACDEKILKFIDDMIQDHYDMIREYQAERRFGC